MNLGRALALLTAFVVACVVPSSPTPPVATSMPAVRCVAKDGLPDHTCTPGALNPAVTPQTIASTICTTGWTATVRPPVAVTEAIKRRMITSYGAYAGSDPTLYELDHLIPLELGGAPLDEANLWPQAWDGPAGAHAKDLVENRLHAAVCAGRMAFDAAQRRIATDWRTA